MVDYSGLARYFLFPEIVLFERWQNNAQPPIFHHKRIRLLLHSLSHIYYYNAFILLALAIILTCIHCRIACFVTLNFSLIAGVAVCPLPVAFFAILISSRVTVRFIGCFDFTRLWVE